MSVGQKARHLLEPPALMKVAHDIVEREDARLPRGADRSALLAELSSE